MLAFFKNLAQRLKHFLFIHLQLGLLYAYDPAFPKLMTFCPKFYELLTEEPLKTSHITYKFGTINLLEENTGKIPFDINHSNIFSRSIS